jgi:hypothetical protein
MYRLSFKCIDLAASNGTTSFEQWLENEAVVFYFSMTHNNPESTEQIHESLQSEQIMSKTTWRNNYHHS